MQEEGHGIAGAVGLVGIDDPMYRGWQQVIGQSAHHVTGIDNNFIRLRFNRQPTAITGQQLQSRIGVSNQQGNQIDVGMGCGAHCLAAVQIGQGRIVQQAVD